MCSGGRGQTLIPWPNRIAGGAYEFDGAAQQLPLTEPSAGNAIHGLTRWATWTVIDRTGPSATLRHVLHPQPGYPFTLDCRLSTPVRRGPARAHRGDEHRRPPGPVRDRRAPLPHGGDGVRRRGHAHRAGRPLPADGRQRHPDRDRRGRGQPVRLPRRTADRRREGRPLLHRPGPGHRRCRDRDAGAGDDGSGSGSTPATTTCRCSPATRWSRPGAGAGSRSSR